MTMDKLQDQLEPFAERMVLGALDGSGMVHIETAAQCSLVSLAISARRIADALEKANEVVNIDGGAGKVRHVNLGEGMAER